MIAGVSWAWWLGFHAVVAALVLAGGFAFCPGIARAFAARAGLRVAGDGGSGAGCGRDLPAGLPWPGPADGARVRGRVHHRGLAQHRQSLCVSGALSRVSESAGSASIRRCCGASGARLCCGHCLLPRALRCCGDSSGSLGSSVCFCSTRHGGWCAAARRARRFRVDCASAAGQGLFAAGDSGRGAHRSALCHGLDSRGAVGDAQSVCGLHVERGGDPGPALALLRAGGDARAVPLVALWAGRDSGLCGAQNARCAVDRGAGDDVAGGDRRDSGGVRGSECRGSKSASQRDGGRKLQA